MARTKLTTATANTPKRKGQLPTKVCATCGRPFEWRKKWARCWEEVRYCSDRCRNSARRYMLPRSGNRRREDTNPPRPQPSQRHTQSAAGKP